MSPWWALLTFWLPLFRELIIRIGYSWVIATLAAVTIVIGYFMLLVRRLASRRLNRPEGGVSWED